MSCGCFTTLRSVGWLDSRLDYLKSQITHPGGRCQASWKRMYPVRKVTTRLITVCRCKHRGRGFNRSSFSRDRIIGGMAGPYPPGRRAESTQTFQDAVRGRGSIDQADNQGRVCVHLGNRSSNVANLFTADLGSLHSERIVA